MATNRITLSGADDVREVVAWAMKNPGVEAFPVYNYIRLEVPDPSGADIIQGDLNGVTIQWDVHDELVIETEEGESNVVHQVAGGAVHVRVGGTVSATSDGFEVENPVIEPERPVVDPALVAAVLAELGAAK